MDLKIKKIGKNKLVLYLPKKIKEELGFNKGEIIISNLKYKKKEVTLVSKMSDLITIKQEQRKYLGVKEGEIINVTISSPKKILKPNTFFSEGNKIDLLFFIPDKTKNRSKIFVEEIIKNNVSHLRICSFHTKGSSRQLEIRRFLDPHYFGKFLGQLQAEGTKGNLGKIEFSNKSLYEHKDFLYFLRYLGIPLDKIFTKFDYHTSVKDFKKQIKAFEDFLGLPVNYVSSSDKSRGGSAFKILVRNTVLYEIIFNSLRYLREHLAKNDLSTSLTPFLDGFFIKLLSGDGSFELITKNKKTPQARLSIYDGNLNFLEDYGRIMKRYGFVPHISKKWKYIRSYCRVELAKKLIEIKAFENNPNSKKLKDFIQLRGLSN